MDDIFLNRLLAMFQQLLGSATTSKNKIEITIGSHNKNKDGKQINGLLNVMGVSEEFLKNSIDDVIEELRKTCTSIEEALKSSGETITSQLQNVILTKFTERIADISKSNIQSLQTKIDIQLTDIVMQIKSSIANELERVIDRQEATLNYQEKIEKALSEYNSQLNREITSLSRLCEDILHNVQLAKEILGEKIDDCKELISKFMQEAELRYKELLNTIQRVHSKESNEEENEFEAHSLDLSTLAKMFDVIKKINKKHEAGEKVNDFIRSSVNEVNDRCKQIQIDINDIRNGTKDGIAKANEILESQRRHFELSKEIYEEVRELRDRGITSIDILYKIIGMIEGLQIFGNQPQVTPIVGSNIVGEQTEAGNEYISKLQELQAYIAEINPKTTKAIFPCPFCGCKEERAVVNGEAHCVVCGHRYGESEPIDPTDNNGIEEKCIEKFQNRIILLRDTEGAEWRQRHSAKLELVSKEGSGENYYRMKLDEEHRPSSKGVIIIPCRTHDNKLVGEICFCMPNTYDKFSKMLLEDVKTVVLANGVSLSQKDKWFGGKQPFLGKRILHMEDLTTMTVSVQEKSEAKNA